MDQYISFSEQRDALTGRKEEQKSGHKAITDLIKVLDAQKNDAIEFTFKQVASYFTKVFQELVPKGHGKLVMIRDKTSNAQQEQQKDSMSSNDATNDDSDSEDNEEDNSSPLETEQQSLPSHAQLRNSNALQYSGVSIKVRFSEGEKETSNLQQLSGGQKSLVALALIFAIQRSDPAPFYLFDEIDQVKYIILCVCSMCTVLACVMKMLQDLFPC
eukprot:m.48389 g.48389  ORF g.48389 m.48389 type:complete len:215 (-) comp10828_c0_seq6:99-743(-)